VLRKPLINLALPSDPPSATALYTGKHVVEDPDATRVTETIGYIVLESGTGVFHGTGYEAGVGPNSVVGITYPNATYSLGGTLSVVSTAIASMAGINGSDGGWAVLYGDNPVNPTALDLSIDEDQCSDLEREHTTEQVGYIVFGF